MKNTTTLILITFSIVMFNACGAGGLSPDSTGPDDPATVKELVEAASADEAAWKDKEVTVTGYASGKSTSGDKYTVTLRNDKDANFDHTLSCKGEGTVPDDIMQKNDGYIYTGKIGYIDKGKSVRLDDCSIKAK